MELFQGSHFSLTGAQKVFANELPRMPTPPAMWTDRQYLPPIEDTRSCQCKQRGLRWLATASRPNTCARFANLAAGDSPMQVGVIYRITDLVKTIESWQSLAISKKSDPDIQALRPAGPPDTAYGAHTKGEGAG